MKRISNWGKSAALLVFGISTLGGLNAPATASSNTPSSQTSLKQGNLQLAQGLVGECRAAKRRIFVYTDRALSSKTIRTLEPNTEVTLAGNGLGGWIGISAPETGYVEAKDLKSCSDTSSNPQPTDTSGNTKPTTPSSTASLCRVVTQAQGLSIRKGANGSSARVGGVDVGNRVTLKVNPPKWTSDDTGRAWVEITAPTAGWVSYGFPSKKATNLGPCS
jgi:hypothetical protein